MSIKINKNGKEYDLGFMPEHYPADRVYLDGDTSKTVQDAIDEIVTDSGWLTLNPSYLSEYRKYGKVVEINVQLLNETTISAQSSILVGSLPSGFRPTKNLYGAGNSNINAIGDGLAFIFIGTNGDVRLYNPTPNNVNYAYANITFIV